ncbi:MAG: flagellar biosynthetic protein FliO [Fimbriimonadales bacterium]
MPKTLYGWMQRAGCALAFTLAILTAQGQSEGAAPLQPGAYGTRAGAPIQRVSAPETPSLGWAQLGVALLIVAAGLRWGLPKLLRWAGRTGDGSPLDGQIKIIETRSALGGSLMLVKARDRLLLIGASAQGMQLIADLTDTLPKPEPLQASPSAFEQALRRAQPATPPTDLQAEAAAQVQTRLQQTRARLQSLIGGEP